VHHRDRPEPARRLGDGVPPPTAYARTYRAGQATVVELRGELDLGSAALVDPHLEAAALWPPPLLVVLDLGPLEFLDCYGLSLLVRARCRVLDRGGELRMVCAHPPTRRLLAMTGLDGVFHPVRTLDEALAP
jgi:anti-sigma B factor antagonist